MALTAEYLRERVTYDPETGVFRWKSMPSNQQRRIGQIAGCLKKKLGYWRVCIDDEEHLAHRLAWLWMTGEWPKEYIDHKDRDRANNKWINLREATQSQNCANKIGSSSKTWPFVKGVSFNKGNRRNPFRVMVEVDGKSKHVGYFATVEEASAAYATAARLVFQEFARTA